MSCRQKRDSAVWHAFGAGILVCASGGHLCFVQRNLWSNLWLRSLRGTPQITGFTVMGYPPLLLSDKISTSYLLPLLALGSWQPQFVCLLSCTLAQVQQGHRLQPSHQLFIYIDKISLSLLFSRLKNHISLSLFSFEKCSRCFIWASCSSGG